MRGSIIIASTFSTDSHGFEEYRYQPTRTSRAIYVIGDNYYAVGKKPPKDEVGEPWTKHSDQFWAEKYGTVLWVSEMSNASSIRRVSK